MDPHATRSWAEMTVAVVTEERLDRSQDGRYWGSSGYRFWARYLSAFTQVHVIARVRAVDTPPVTGVRTDGPNVRVMDIPYYVGPRQYVAARSRVRRAITAAVRPSDAVLLRVGSQLGSLLHPHLTAARRPYGVEVVGDPDEVFASGAVEHPLRPVFRWWFSRQQRRMCAGACAAAYVTKHTLQAKYPCRAYMVGVSDVEVMSTHYSSVDLGDEAFTGVMWTRARLRPGGARLVAVGSLAQPYKGIDVLLSAMATCLARGVEVQLVVVGDGVYRTQLEAQAQRLGLGSRVRFTGALPGPVAVQQELDGGDLFVMPSRTEGLPRALVEAMARGLPCIGSRVGGIPELLDESELVPRGDVNALATKIADCVTDPSRLERMARQNFERAKEFRADALEPRRRAFYEYLRHVTDAWQTRSDTSGDVRRVA